MTDIRNGGSLALGVFIGFCIATALFLLLELFGLEDRLDQTIAGAALGAVIASVPVLFTHVQSLKHLYAKDRQAEIQRAKRVAAIFQIKLTKTLHHLSKTLEKYEDSEKQDLTESRLDIAAHFGKLGPEETINFSSEEISSVKEAFKAVEMENLLNFTTKYSYLMRFAETYDRDRNKTLARYGVEDHTMFDHHITVPIPESHLEDTKNTFRSLSNSLRQQQKLFTSTFEEGRDLLFAITIALDNEYSETTNFLKVEAVPKD